MVNVRVNRPGWAVLWGLFAFCPTSLDAQEKTNNSTEPIYVKDCYVASLSFSPDGKRIAYVNPLESRLYVHTIRDGQTTGFPPRSHAKEEIKQEFRCESVAFSPDGKSIAAAGYIVRLWDTLTGKSVQILDHPAFAAFSPDGNLIALVNIDKGLKIYDVKAGKVRQALVAESGRFVGNPVFSPDGKSLVVTTMQNEIIFYDTGTWKVLETINDFTLPKVLPKDAQNHGVFTAVAGKANRLFGATRQSRRSREAEFRIWDFKDRTLQNKVERSKVLGLREMAVTPDGNYCIVTSTVGTRLLIIDLLDQGATKNVPMVYHKRCGGFTSLAISPDGKTFAAGSTGFYIFDIEKLYKESTPLRR